MKNHTLARNPIAKVLMATLFAGLFGQQAFAQSSEIQAAAVSSCGVNGSVSITLLGLTTTLPLPCTSQIQLSGPGSEQKSTKAIDLGLLGLVRIVKLEASLQRADYTNLPDATAFDSASDVADLSLVQDLVGLRGITGQLSCDSLSGSTVLQCQAGTTLTGLRIAGRDVLNLPLPIPRDFTLPVGGTIQLNVLGIPISVPVGGAVSLNKVYTVGVGGNSVHVSHHPVLVSLGGSVSVLGLGLVGVSVQAGTSAAAVNVNTNRPVTDVQIEVL